MSEQLTHAQLLQLKRWNTPTIFNGWEQITQSDPAADGFNLEPVQDHMPHMGPMVGYAVTVTIEPSQSSHKERIPNGWSDYRHYIAAQPGPKIVVVQDLDKPRVIGSFWGEVNANTHRALGCVGTIVDGAIRDVDEMCNAGFKGVARTLCVGHAHSWPVSWGEPVEVFGRRVEPGQLIHADKHGFLVIPKSDEARLLDASVFIDRNECETVIPAARDVAGKPMAEVLDQMDAAGVKFGEKASQKFGSAGEWS